MDKGTKFVINFASFCLMGVSDKALSSHFTEIKSASLCIIPIYFQLRAQLVSASKFKFPAQ